MSANKQQIEFWSGGGGDYWVDKQFEMDTMLNPLGQKAIDSLDIQKGDSVLDVGCGTGTTTLLLSEKVGLHSFLCQLINNKLNSGLVVVATIGSINNLRWTPCLIL